ncbi:MAG: hypothetical protein V1736_07105 [Pseudomonadota bacterium]
MLDAEVIASDCYWDGHNFERHGRNTYLYKTPKGRYFATYLTMWEGERDHLEPLSVEDAIRLFQDLPEKEMDFEEAFPGSTVEEA